MVGFAVLALIFEFLTAFRAFAVSIEHTAVGIVLQSDAFTATFSDRNGSILSVAARGKAGSVFHSGESGLWSVAYKEGGASSAMEFATNTPAKLFTWDADASGETLRLNYASAAVAVTVSIAVHGDSLDFTGRIESKTKTVLEFALPGRLRFNPDDMGRLVCPLNANESVGAAFKPAFFKAQPQEKPAGWKTQVYGPGGYSSLFGGALISRADDDPAVPLLITASGYDWLGTNLASRLNGSLAVVNRPSTRTQASLTIADSANGPFFSAYRLGGQGYIFRLGGGVGTDQRQLAMDLVGAAVEHLASTTTTGRTNIGLLALYHGPLAGNWAATGVGEWRTRLQSSIAASPPGLRLVELTTAQAMLDALATTNYLAILNPYGEATPVLEEKGMAATLAAIGSHVRKGGNWFEVGGYSFYYELRPSHYYSYETQYPPAFADFFHFEAPAGGAALFGVQPQKYQPWEGRTNPTAIFVPGRLAWGGDPSGGYCERAFGVCIAPGSVWPSPVVRIQAVGTAPEALDAYCRANEFNRKLESKMTPALFETFKRSVLIYYGGTATAKLAYIGQLPAPALVHFADYLKGGFDKEYPDHLPPNPSFGAAIDFAAFLARCRELGHIAMPYTNPTWWCDHPRGPTFAAAGEAPLLKRLDGSLAYENYSGNDGYTVCHWHPAVLAANRKTVLQFTTDYPVDAIFQDQCGARSWQYDTNPASPSPIGYADGLISMVAEDSRSKILSTENGWDRIVNYESQLCGMTWQIVPTENAPEWRTFFKDRFPPETWNIFPLAQWIAHDKTSMLHHDLGQFVTDDEVLAWTLGLGYGLSYRVDASSLSLPARREWLRWLDRLQKSVCARYIGEPVRSFAHDRGAIPSTADDGTISAIYGEVGIEANLGAQPKTNGAIVLAPHGFRATAPSLVAGNLRVLGNVDFSDEGISFVSEGDDRKAEFWIFSRGERDVAIELPQVISGTVAVQFDGGLKISQQTSNAVLALHLGYRPDQQHVQPPVAIEGKAPLDWPGARPAIGILNLPGMSRSWTKITPDDWLKAFRTSNLAMKYAVPIRELTTVADLTSALKAGPTVWLGIVNPYGEIFPESSVNQWRAALDSIRDYVNHGGSWWETGGYSFYTASFRNTQAWLTETVGPAGMTYLGLPVGGGEVDQAPELLTVTLQGQEILGGALSARLTGMRTAVNRALPRSSIDPGHLTLLAGALGDFLGAYRLNGWGCLWRAGGFWPNPDVLLPAVTATMEYIYTHPPLPVDAGPIRYFWHGTVVKTSPPVLKKASFTSDGFSFQIVDAPAGSSNLVERSFDLGSSNAWEAVPAIVSETGQVLDPSALKWTNAFYRVKSVSAP